MKSQWHLYQDLELIPASSSAPPLSYSPIAQKLMQIWRGHLNRVAAKLTPAQQVERLKRCYATETVGLSEPQGWAKVWWLMNQPLFTLQAGRTPEPEVWRSADAAGNVWWHVYDPTTGYTAALETEEEVQIWLEERLYHY